jgi:DNA gyrase subunit A
MMAVRSGKAIRFNEAIVRPIGRTASGVRGITLGNQADEVIGMICVNDSKDDILVLSENGYGKRSSLADYRITNRGGKGVKTINITEKTGNLISVKNVGDDNDLMIITQNGLTIRVAVKTIRIMGRAAQGVKIINLKNGDRIASVAKVRHEIEGKDISAIEDSPETGEEPAGEN